MIAIVERKIPSPFDRTEDIGDRLRRLSREKAERIANLRPEPPDGTRGRVVLDDEMRRALGAIQHLTFRVDPEDGSPPKWWFLNHDRMIGDEYIRIAQETIYRWKEQNQ